MSTRDRQPTDGRARHVRLLQFVRERFLPIPQVVLVLVMTWYGAAFGALATGGSTGDHEMTGPSAAVLLLAAALLFFFRLRVFDDVKDAAHDRAHEPGRPIPRGLVTEGELNGLAGALLVLEWALLVPLGPPVVIAWAIAATWTLLMRVEFFCGTWLERHITTYAVTHMLSMVPFAVLASTAGRVIEGHPAASIGDALVPFDALALAWAATFILGIGFEFGRKFDRYHDALHAGAWVIWAGAPALGGLLASVALGRFDADMGLYATLSAGALMASLSALRTIRTKGRAASGATIELTPSALGLLMLLIGSVLTTMEVM